MTAADNTADNTAEASPGPNTTAEALARAAKAMTAWLTEANTRLAPVTAPMIGRQDRIFTAGDAFAHYRVTHARANNIILHWIPRSEHNLEPLLPTRDPQALADLIGQWLDHLATLPNGLPPELDNSDDDALLHLPYLGEACDRLALITIPAAMDFAPRVMIEAGFAPFSSSAVRPVRPGDSSIEDTLGPWWERPYTFADGLILRAACQADLPALMDLTLAIHHSDYLAGCNSKRANLHELYHPWVQQVLTFPPSARPVIEVGGQVIGYASLNPLADSRPFGSLTSVKDTRYLGFLSVAAGERGKRIGSRLMDVIHARAAATQAGGVLTQFASLSSYSGHFYYRHGYSPLNHMWKKIL